PPFARRGAAELGAGRGAALLACAAAPGRPCCPRMSEEPLQRFAHWVEQAERILFITGAGISADSGLPTYRGVGGLYEDVATEDGLAIEDALSGLMMHE